MIDDIDWLAIERYLSDDLHPGEREAVERWIQADPARQRLVASLSTIREGIRALPDPADDAPAQWQALAARLDAPALGRPRRVRRDFGWRVAPARLWWTRIAAVVALAVLGGLGYRATMKHAPAHINTAAMREYVTPRGQRARVLLPDGTRVTLAAQSRLRAPAGQNPSVSTRDVYLEGEAFFEVRHDPARPFRVHAVNGVAEDLGTEFVVTAYPETRGVRVVVASGVVALRTADTLHARARAALTLTRGDLAQLDSSGTATLTRNVPIASYVAWVQGSLLFDGTRLRDALPQLARWYDLDIRVTDSTLSDRRFTATFRHESAAQVLEVLAGSLDLQVERYGRSVVLSPKRSPS